MRILCGGNSFAGGIEEGILDSNFLLSRILIVNLYLTIVHIYTPVLNMDGVSLSEPYMAIYATTRVPTGIRLIRVIHTDGNYILALVYVWGNVILETGVSIRSKTNLLPIDINSRVHVNTIEFQENIYILTFFNFYIFPIPPYSTRQGSTTSTRRVTCIEIALDGPIMRNIQSSPMGIIILN